MSYVGNTAEVTFQHLTSLFYAQTVCVGNGGFAHNLAEKLAEVYAGKPRQLCKLIVCYLCVVMLGNILKRRCYS